jgi:hydroxyacylglutathione hydrolase
MKDPFERDHAPVPGVPEALGPGLRVVTAPNPGPMTFTGTRTYLVGEAEVAVIDPGPEDDAHRVAVLAAIGAARVVAILVTHAHSDHAGGAAALAACTGAPVLAHGDPRPARPVPEWARGGGEGIAAAFRPDRRIADGERIEAAGWRLEALHTPGHLGDHLAFAWPEAGVVFTGDVLMGWSTTMISPPEGDLAAFLASLDRLAARPEPLFLPGHGAPVRDPRGLIAWQKAHRAERTAQIAAALDRGPLALPDLVATVYPGLDPRLLPAAARTALAHLVALAAEGRVAAAGEAGAERFRLS